MLLLAALLVKKMPPLLQRPFFKQVWCQSLSSDAGEKYRLHFENQFAYRNWLFIIIAAKNNIICCSCPVASKVYAWASAGGQGGLWPLDFE